MSVGHLARILEDGGIPTVVIACQPFETRLQAMSLPRLVLTPHPMGQVFGAPGDQRRQREILLAALELLEKADQGGQVVRIPGGYRMPISGK